MNKFRILLSPILLLLALALAGCGGVTLGDSKPPVMPVEDITKPGSLSGTCYVLEQQVLDNPAEVTVSLYLETAGLPAASPTQTTTSLIRGGYQFASVPKGIYTLHAELPSRYTDGATLIGDIHGVVVRGNIPTLQANIILGPTADVVTLTGTVTGPVVTPAGTITGPVKDAQVSLMMVGYSVAHWLTPTNLTTIQASIHATTDAEGKYTLTAPKSGVKYVLNASSPLGTSNLLTVLLPDASNTTDIEIISAGVVPFPFIDSFDYVSTTFDQPTTRARADAYYTRQALTASDPNSLQGRAAARSATRAATRAVVPPSLVENDLIFWYDSKWINPADGLLYPVLNPSIQGFNVYRNTSATQAPVWIGANQNRQDWGYIDNDPALKPLTQYQYYIAAYAENNQVGKLSPPVIMTALPPIEVNTPDGAIMSRVDGKLSWKPVPGAKSYVVQIYAVRPTYGYLNPVQENRSDSVPSMITLPVAGATEMSIPLRITTAYTFPVDFWWNVSAGNDKFFDSSFAATYTQFRKLTVTE